MKTVNIFKKLFVATALFGTIVLIPSCDKDDDNNNDTTYAISGSASGSQQNPPIVTGGSSTLTGTYNSRSNHLNYTITWTGLTGVITAAHFHGPATTSENANSIIDISIGTNGISGTTSGSVTLADSTEAYLLAGKIYYNLHTAAFVDGEVRGQVVATANN